MSVFYKDMPEDFQQAVEVIKRYCQVEDCTEDCEECDKPLSYIRCGDDFRFEQLIEENRRRIVDGQHRRNN